MKSAQLTVIGQRLTTCALGPVTLRYSLGRALFVLKNGLRDDLNVVNSLIQSSPIQFNSLAIVQFNCNLNSSYLFDCLHYFL